MQTKQARRVNGVQPGNSCESMWTGIMGVTDENCAQCDTTPMVTNIHMTAMLLGQVV